MENKELEFTFKGTVQDAVSYLYEIANSLYSGKVVVRKIDEIIEMNPQNRPTEIFLKTTKNSNGKEKISIELEWDINDETMPVVKHGCGCGGGDCKDENDCSCDGDCDCGDEENKCDCH